MKYSKLVASILLSTTLFTAGTGLISVSNVSADNVTSIQKSSKKQIDALLAQLSAQKQAEFFEITKGAHLSKPEQISLLTSYVSEHSQGTPAHPEYTNLWKLSVAKKIAEYGAKAFGIRFRIEALDFFLDTSNSIQNGIQRYLISIGWNSSAAYWTARAITFAIF